MGCNPFGKMISMAIGRQGGKEKERGKKKSRKKRKHRGDTPPPVASHSMAKSVIYGVDSCHTAAAQPPKTLQPPGQPSDHHHGTLISPSPHAYAAAPSAGEPEEEEEEVGGVPYKARSDPYYNYRRQESLGYRYVQSPSPGAAGGEHGEGRREYFGGEYHYYYPTPVREGIYRIATDAGNRLTTMFSDENPNACRIV